MRLVVFSFAIYLTAQIGAQTRLLEPMDLFNFEYALNLEISPDVKRIVYQRRGLDIMADTVPC